MIMWDYYERQASIRRQIAHHVSKLGAPGFEVTLCRIPAPKSEPGEPPTLRPPDPTAPAGPGQPTTAQVRFRAPGLGPIFGSLSRRRTCLPCPPRGS
jgi:hypothetical protein